MTSSAVQYGAGDYGFSFVQPPDTTIRERPGTLIAAQHAYFGGWELVYGRATASIRQFGLVTLGGAFASGIGVETTFTETANTANTGAPVAVALFAMTTGQYGWAVVRGAVPVNSTASIAAGATAGIGAAGQAGANSAGKQILGAVGAIASSQTVATFATANAGSNRLVVNSANGWFPGIYLSGTGIAAGTTVLSIDPDNRGVTISAATTALVNGTVTGTFNNGTIHYNTLMINRPCLQGAIT